MAADQERADRIRALKQARPDLTWRRIADHVGVTERSATDWQKKGGIEYDNAKKLAELFEVEVDYIWRGIESDTPSPFAGQDGFADLLDEVKAQLAAATSERDNVARLVEDQAQAIALQAEALRAQAEVLVELRDAVRELRETVATQQTSARRLDDEVQQTIQRLQGAVPLPEAAAGTTEH